ncbi:MAG: PAS domain S-box protein, partial [Rhodospirillaceae bacterium]|nr:PAS domain S-box protein [Rhodospirillaceae bacterium]
MPDITKALAMLAGADSVGDEFFETATTALLAGLGCRLAGISCLSDDGKFVRALAPIEDGVLVQLPPIALAEIPAGALYDDPGSEPLHIAGDLGVRFPNYQTRLSYPARSYSATLFFWPDGRPAGHVFIVDDRVVRRDAEAWEFFELVARRIGAEYSRRSGFAGSVWLDTLVDGAGAGMVMSDAAGKFVLANDTFAQWLGFSRGSDLVGTAMQQWIDPAAWNLCVKASLEVVKHGTIDEFELPFVDRNGVRRELSVILTRDKTPSGTRFLGLLRDIKDRKDAEIGRLQSETRFRNLIEGSLEGIFVADAEMRPMFANPMAAKMFGYGGPEEILALGNNAPLVAPHELARMKEWRRQIFSGENTVSAQEFEGRRKDGSPIWVRSVARRVVWDGKPAVQSTAQDITDRRRAEEERAEAEARLRAIIDNAPFSIIFKDREGRYVAMNKKAEEWLGTTIEQIIGKMPDAIQLLNSGTRERDRDLEVLNEARIVSYEAEISVSPEIHTLWITKFPILGPDGIPEGLCTIVSDITDRKQYEDILQRQRQEAEFASNAKTRFLAAASHDLRQPLHSMELMLEILARQISVPVQQELVSDIKQAASIAAGLLNPLLDYSRLEAGMVDPEIEEFPVSSLLRDMDVGFKSQAEEAGLELRIMPSSAVIHSDPVLLSRIVGNFVSNGIRYTQTGRLLLGCRRRGDRLRIEVWDNGPGIEEEHLNVIFEEFHQIETTTRDRDKGLGLGLAIVQVQAKLLGHEVRVNSRFGRGSTFMIEVPLTDDEDLPLPATVVDVAEQASLDGLRMMIL